LPEPFDIRGFWAELVAGVDETNKRVRVKFNSTTATFSAENRPEFALKLEGQSPLSPQIVGTCSTVHQIYEWIVRGTEKHPIAAKNKKALAFPGLFVAKTTPGVIASGPGFSGGDTVIRKEVMHPGTKPRNFDVIIGEQIEPVFAINMNQALARAVKASGHSTR